VYARIRWYRIVSVRAIWSLPFVAFLGSVSAFAQGDGTSQPQLKNPPRFEDYPVTEVFKGKSVQPVFTTPEERRFETVIRQGVGKGWGVFDGATGIEISHPSPNFAGHYTLIMFGCGASVLKDCLMAAIVDAKTGQIFALPSLDPPSQMPHFGIFAEFTTEHPPFSFHSAEGSRFDPSQSPFEYRVNSSLLIAKVCDGSEASGGSVIVFNVKGCGDHFYRMGEDGLKLAYHALDDNKAPPRFEDYPVAETLRGIPVNPVISTPDERLYRTKIREGVAKGFGVEGPDGKERFSPNFAGHYFIITWGCGSPCLMAAIVDAKTGRVDPPPFHHGPGHSYFQVPWASPVQLALDYRLDSRLLIANICEIETRYLVLGQVRYPYNRCGPHYFVMEEGGLRLVYRDVQ
jgi:hypothetical protein